ncbi:hypothetical protein D3C76_1039480 [compost metagenome]
MIVSVQKAKHFVLAIFIAFLVGIHDEKTNLFGIRLKWHIDIGSITIYLICCKWGSSLWKR